MTEWLEYFVDGVAEELGRVRDKVLDLSKDRRLYGKIGQVALNARQIEILKFIEEHNAMSNPDFVRLFPKVSDDTILRDIKDLMEKGIIRKSGKTKGAKYQLQ
jgi:predicted HTH transcriptional regulator